MDNESKLWRWVANIVLMIISAAALLPFILLIISSISSEKSILQIGYSFFPIEYSLDAYRYLYNHIDQLLRAYGVTFLVTTVGTIGGLLFTAMIAYPLSRKELPLRRVFNFLVLFTILFNGGLVPTYWVYSRFLGVRNTLWAYVLPNLLVNGFGVLLMKSFFITTIPEEILDAAKIDGAGEIRVFTSIILPMSTPVLATMGLLKAISYWNDWFNGMIYIAEPRLYSIQNLLNRMLTDIQFITQSADLASRVDIGAMPSMSVRMAIAVIGVLPILMVYPFFQKYFVRGITLGAIKG